MTTSNYTKPLPVPSKWSKAFWDNAKQHKLTFKKCSKCGTIDQPPYLYCTNCGAEEHTWIPSSGKGTLYTYSTTYIGAPPAFTADQPFTIVVVDLAEGTRMMSTIVEAKPEDLKIGMAVEVVWDDVTPEVSLPRFRPVKK